MRSIADKTKQTINLEEKKNFDDKNFSEFNQLLTQIDKLGYFEKPNYSFPLVDTIGKTTYSTLNKHSV
jgi:hypothetical protein